MDGTFETWAPNCDITSTPIKLLRTDYYGIENSLPKVFSKLRHLLGLLNAARSLSSATGSQNG